MTTFSVNVNKVALLRNSRGGTEPDVVEAAKVAIANGADGITVHPREDQRHIRLDDVVALSEITEIANGDIEFNIEGDLRPELLRLTRSLKPTQFTVVAVMPGEVTSTRGWRAYDDHDELKRWTEALDGVCRVAVFADADRKSVGYAADGGADAVEFYTGTYAEQFHSPNKAAELGKLSDAAGYARENGMRVHAGHDLNTENLPDLFAACAIDEVSIGHAIASEALFEGFGPTIAKFRSVIPSQ